MSKEWGQTSRALEKSSINVEEQGERRFRTRRTKWEGHEECWPKWNFEFEWDPGVELTNAGCTRNKGGWIFADGILRPESMTHQGALTLDAERGDGTLPLRSTGWALHLSATQFPTFLVHAVILNSGKDLGHIRMLIDGPRDQGCGKMLSCHWAFSARLG